jgi:uncharacterized protein (TIGR03437 family)
MTSRKFKLPILTLFTVFVCLRGLESNRVAATSSGPPNGYTGAPGEPTCAVSGCHSTSDLNSGGGTLSIAGLPSNYAPNQEVELTLTLAHPSRPRYGFSLTALDEMGRGAGDLLLLEATRTQKSEDNILGRVRQYVSHTLDGLSPNGQNQNSWRIRWKAPAQAAGIVTFYAAGNAANGNGGTGGDFIYATSARVQPPAIVTALANVSAASFAPSAALAPESIAAAFGTNLAASTASANGTPLPIDIGGTQLVVRDAAGIPRSASLFFVSPGQINYLLPSGIAPGFATVSARRNGAEVAQGSVQIEAVAPGLFAANAAGQGLAAAVIFRRKANGEESFEPVAQFNAAANRFDPVPVDLGAATDQVFLILFGTGFRGRSALAAVSATIGGAPSEVSFAGSQGSLAGLDQANLLLPRSLAGRGLVDIAFKADNRTANTVTVFVK